MAENFLLPHLLLLSKPTSNGMWSPIWKSMKLHWALLLLLSLAGLSPTHAMLPSMHTIDGNLASNSLCTRESVSTRTIQYFDQQV
jgi:hypothetical protein